ncbi:MAG: gamma carbonic anhydrase family protein [Bacteroidetes bacterium]|nr:gamma carbonic anhydrase family protein [Bacteroidota bacterium]
MESAFLQNLRNQVEKADDVFIAPDAQVFGRVRLGKSSSVWFGAILRGDSDWITIGERTNIQDGCIVHVDPGVPVTIGKGCVLGHAAIAHGCTIGDNSLIGMRATVMNRAVIGKNCIIGSHALVTEGKVIPDNSMVLGSPGKVVRTLTDAEVEGIKRNAAHYVELAKKYLG